MNTIQEETSNPSLKLLSCRACLATDIKLFNIYENKLAEAFAHITGSPVLLSDGLPQHLCSYCRSTLLKCRVFRARSLRAQHCLRAVPLQIELTTDYIRTIDRHSHQLIYLTQTRVETTDYRDILEVDVKKEESDIDNFIPESDDLKIEYEIKDKIDEGIDNGDFSDDNTEQIFVATNPVRDVKVRKGRKKKTKAEEKRVKKKIKKRTSDNDYLPDFDFAKFESSYSVEIIALTKEQQLEEIRARKQSANYQYAAYKCEECGKGFMANDAYNNHKIRHSPSMGAHACEICLVRFKRQSRRQEHQDLHRLKFLCKECSFVSRNRYQAKKHFEWHSGKIHVCKHCGASFTKSSTYLSHVRLQHPAMNVACDVCGETFVGRLGLLQHKSRAHQVGSPCEGVSSTHLSHVRLQHPAMNVACDVCGETFVGRLGLLQHKSRAHQVGSPCEGVSSTHLSHVRLQHPAMNVACDVCGETFVGRLGLLQHKSRAHQVGSPCEGVSSTHLSHVRLQHPAMNVACDVCGETFVGRLGLLQHKSRAHQVGSPCEGVSSTHLSHVRLQHPAMNVACDVCGETFVGRLGLLQHKSRAHQVGSPCEGVSSTHLSHVRLQHPAMNVACDVCGETFVGRLGLLQHKSRAHQVGSPSSCDECGMRRVRRDVRGTTGTVATQVTSTPGRVAV
ncbi:zinc finger protein 225-like [Cydia fagiglandana]|uniref:zinc finger protein 225-like n=1 Tax=Cydia fagiglandana TaxID=1458189 RepID=UPI002FEE3778